ncbi:MAG: hypothetical protein MJ158_01185 [Alphaproteobacteria bacterium]|nr:hypothetical protein [Alphaproteobacteria bacterium]
MKKIITLCLLISTVFLFGCSCKCSQEPVLQANKTLIVPPNFGKMPK